MSARPGGAVREPHETTAAETRPGLIGVLVDDFEPFSAEVLKGVATALHGSRFDLVARSGASRHAEAGWERGSLERLRDADVQGAILMTPSCVVEAAGMPLVVIDPLISQTELHSVTTDDFGGAVLATRHLAELGHRRIALIAGRPDLESAHLRGAGYRRALADAGLPYDPDLVRIGHYRRDASLEAARDLLLLPDPPTAVFAANDASAIAVVEAARERGVPVPERLSVVGYDDVPDAARVAPPLTTVRQPLHRLGRAAARVLMTLIEGGVPEERHLQLRNRLVLRASTAPPPAAA